MGRLINMVEDEGRPSGFHAQVNGASLADLIQLNCLGRQRAAFKVSSSEGEGYLYFHSGQIVHAEFDELVGEEALFRMFAAETGVFEPSRRAWPSNATISTGWETLVLRAAQRSDEAKSGVTPAPGMTRAASPAPDTTRSPRPSVKPQSSHSTSVKSSAVRLTKSGEVLSSRGEVDGLTETAAYAFGLGNLVGEALGLGPAQALEFELQGDMTLIYEDEDQSLVAISAPPESMQSLRRKAGLL